MRKSARNIRKRKPSAKRVMKKYRQRVNSTYSSSSSGSSTHVLTPGSSGSTEQSSSTSLQPTSGASSSRFPRRLTPSTESEIHEELEKLSNGQEATIFLDLPGGSLVMKPTIGGYLDSFINTVHKDFDEIAERDKRFEKALDIMRVEYAKQQRAGRYISPSAPRRPKRRMRSKRTKKIYMRNITEEDRVIIENIRKVWLIVKRPQDYLDYKFVSTMENLIKQTGSVVENIKISFDEERDLWSKLGKESMVLIADVRSDIVWQTYVEKLEKMYKDQESDMQEDSKLEDMYEDQESDMQEDQELKVFSANRRRMMQVSPMKKRRSRSLRQQRPEEKYKNLYNYLCFYLEPIHDFFGKRSADKDKGTGSLARSSGYKELKKDVEKVTQDGFKEFLLNNVLDSSTRPYLYTGTNEGMNLLEIMGQINAREKCISLSFADSQFTPKDAKIEASSLEGEIVAGIEAILKHILDVFFSDIIGGRIYRDAGGTDFIHGLEGKYKDVSEYKGEVLFAEKLLDGAGSKSFTGNESVEDRKLKVDYRKEVFNYPGKDFEWNKVIVQDEPREDDTIQISPYPLSINNEPVVERKFKIKLQDKNTIEFDPFVNDFSVFIRYYINKYNNTKNEKYKDIIWVLLNLKRAGDHGQAERAKLEPAGIFESGDRLAAAYGMMIDARTLFRYTTELTMYKCASTVGQIVGRIKANVGKSGLYETFNVRQMEMEYQESYSTPVDKLDASKRTYLVDVLTVTSALKRMSEYDAAGSVKIKELFAKLLVKYNKYIEKIASGKRTEGSLTDVAGVVLTFYTNKNSYKKIVEGFEILIRVFKELFDILSKEEEKIKSARIAIIQKVKNVINLITKVDTTNLAGMLLQVDEQLKKYRTTLSSKYPTLVGLAAKFSNAFSDVSYDVSLVIDQLTSFREYCEKIEGLIKV